MEKATGLLRRHLRASLRPASTTCSRHASRAFATTRKALDTYSFIGIGAMGYPMASNLRQKLPAQDSLLVYDVNNEATAKLQEEQGLGGGNVEVVASAREAAERSDTIITALPQPSHIDSVFASIDPATLPPPPCADIRLFIDCSTIDPATSHSVAKRLPAHAMLIDAPMSGGVVGARNATLTFMLGAPESLAPRATALLQLLGARVLHMGPPGTGLAAKLANNYLLAVSNVATAEAMHLGTSLGLDPTKLAELINGSSGRCWSSEVNNPVPGVSPGAPAERGYRGGFAVPLMLKDLRLARAAAGEAGVSLELAEEVQRVYEEVEGREGAKDFSVVYRWLKNRELRDKGQ